MYDDVAGNQDGRRCHSTRGGIFPGGSQITTQTQGVSLLLMWGAAAAVWVVAVVGLWGGEAAAHGRYTLGDALIDPTAPGPDGKPYPSLAAHLANPLLPDSPWHHQGTRRQASQPVTSSHSAATPTHRRTPPPVVLIVYAAKPE
ncbi:hypothetical protein E2C01_022883 [Portunus trituberculatus]|uniref:Uncharacterized protein n=1 Tax=Portunus trituberculatus TaxID=210409 RepID=A0A5B7E8A8_PORTR|nr:hypothetical protein [Portunus trituberculatus]